MEPLRQSRFDPRPHTAANPATGVEQWGLFELALPGPAEGNPFLDVEFGARFSYKHRTVEVDGFYDGAGIYRPADGPWYVGPGGRISFIRPSSDGTCSLYHDARAARRVP